MYLRAILYSICIRYVYEKDIRAKQLSAFHIELISRTGSSRRWIISPFIDTHINSTRLSVQRLHYFKWYSYYLHSTCIINRKTKVVFIITYMSPHSVAKPRVRVWAFQNVCLRFVYTVISCTAMNSIHSVIRCWKLIYNFN